MSIITVRRTRDPFCANIAYVTSCKVTLEDNGDLNMKNIGVAAIYKGKFFHLKINELISAADIKKYTSKTDEPILSVVKLNDAYAAESRIQRAEQIAHLKESFSHAWTWLASSLFPATSSDDESQTNEALPQATPQDSESYFSWLRSSMLTCLRRKPGGGYVKLEEDIVENKT